MANPGDIIERYRIIELLGRGGMGEVYRAHDARLQRDVALKILAGSDGSSGSAGTDGGARMLREARAAAALDHPNVVSIYDVGEVLLPGTEITTTYIAMELIRGRSLRDHVGDPRAPVRERLKWLSQIASALEAAHAIGLVHRDVKPENVMIREDGVVKVLDFGIAKRTRPPLHARSSTAAQVLSTLTGDGVAMGTPLYMAPEQMLGEPVDGRTDQFAWGVVAYELLAGELPWGKNVDALKLVASLLSKQAPRLDEKALHLPAGIAEVVARALSKQAAERYPSMRAVKEALAADEPSLPVTTGPRSISPRSASVAAPVIANDDHGRRRVRRMVPLAVGGVALTALAVLVTMGVRATRGPSPVASGASSSAKTPDCTRNAQCSKDGAQASFCRKPEGVCVPLASPNCTVHASPADLASDDTLFIGALLPTGGAPPDGPEMAALHALELARQDFAATMGTPSAHASLGRARSFAMIACDETRDPERAVKHLVETVRVPAVIGFGAGTQLIDLSGPLLAEHTLAVATLTSNPLITAIPEREGEPRLIWRTTPSATQAAAAVSALVPEVIERELRTATPPIVDAQRPLKIALVRSKARSLAPMSEAIFNGVRFNGKSALENGSNYREIVLDEANADERAQSVEVLTLYAPQVILYTADLGIKDWIEAVEDTWSKTTRYRPHWIAMSALTPAVIDYASKSGDRRRRFLGIDAVSSRPANARFVLHFNDTFPEKVTRGAAPSSSYDAFYLVAYAAYALGDEPATGPSLARAFGRLMPPGRSIDVGIAGIFDAYSALQRGERLDLNGAAGALDLDRTTGEASFDQEIVCVATGEHGEAVAVGSGLVYDAAARALRGALRCK